MLSFETTRILKNLLETICETEMIIERQRQTLGEHIKFAPYSAFCRIDRRARECLEAPDIQAYLESNGSRRTVAECAKLIRYFDSDNDRMLSYADFIQLVLPCDNNDLRMAVQRRPYTRIGRFDTLDYEIECGLSNIIKHELDLIGRSETLIRELQRYPDFSPHAAFRAIDRYEEGMITHVNLSEFFRQFSNYLTEAEVYAIIRRIDTDGDAKIKFDEFCDFLMCPPARSNVMVPAASSPAKGSKQKSPAKPHRSDRFETPSKIDAASLAMIEDRDRLPKHRAMMASLARAEAVTAEYGVRPKQVQPLKQVHFSSPLRGSPSRDYSPARPVMTSGVANRATLPSSNDLERSSGNRWFESETGLVQMVNEHISLERGLEKSKQVLVDHPDFNLFDAFRIFDVDGVGSVTAKEFFYGLSDIGVHTQMEDVDLFFKRFNKRRNGRMDFGEFATAMDPTDDYYAQMLARRPQSSRRLNIYRKDDLFCPDTAHCFKDLLLTHLRVEASAETLRQHLSNNPFFDVNTAYDVVDMSGRGIVTKDEIRRLLERRGQFISDQEARTVARKFDFNGDGVISYGEFAEEVRPKSPVRRI